MHIMALAVIVVAAFQVASQFAFRVFNTKGAETLVKSMRDQLYSHKNKGKHSFSFSLHKPFPQF